MMAWLVASAVCVGSGRARDEGCADRWGVGGLRGVGVCTMHRLDVIKDGLYIIQILCRRHPFGSYPAGLTIVKKKS